MADRPPLNEEELANLVAFLDGELDEESARQVEAKLSLDPTARAPADALRRTWDLLDYLPRPEPSPQFTNRTIDRVSALRPQATASQAVRRRRPWLIGLGWAAAVLLASTTGFAAVRLLAPHEGAAPTQPVDLEQ